MGYSPILSVITAIFEISAAIWALSGRGRKTIIYTASAILILLAGYQILEAVICTSWNGLFLLKLAFIDVAWLPPAGLLLISHLFTGKNQKTILIFSVFMFLSAAGIVVWIFLDNGFVVDSVCRVVFAQYSNPMPKYLYYSGFYWIGLFSMMLLSAMGMGKVNKNPDKKQLKLLLLGSILFIVLSLITVLIFSGMQGTLASVMCHFALFFAIFITRLIYLERKFYNNQVAS
ncbi:hypothetical protein J7K93_10980 [bacterium]|nr:hypothetical protein [bacterium]